MVKIIDTHVHVWNLESYRLPWLDSEGPVLARTWSPEDYSASQVAGHGYDLEQTVYIEVDMAAEERQRENELACSLVADESSVFGGACISGDLTGAGFASYMEPWADNPVIKGVRQVLHVPSTAPGTCLDPQFMENVRWLGARNLVFEGCLRCPEIGDLAIVARECPETTIVLDHMGIVDADIIAAPSPTPEERAYQVAWKKNMSALGQLPNVVCKVSGLNPVKPWNTESLARAVDVAFDAFDDDKLMFASNFPVLNVAMTFDDWVCALIEITEGLDSAQRAAFFAENARRTYRL